MKFWPKIQLKPSRLMFVVLSLFIMFSWVGCGSNLFEGMADENSKEARQEQVLQLFDDGNYSEALTLLQTIVTEYPGDPLFVQYLSNAFAGLAGLDTFNLLEVIDAVDDAGEEGSIDMVGLVLGDALGRLTLAQVNAKLDFIDSAVSEMDSITVLNDDQTIQMGLLSVTHMSLTLAKLIMAERAVDTITLTDAGIGALYAPGENVDLDGIDPADVDLDAALVSISADIVNMSGAVVALKDNGSDQNDISDQFQEFQDAIDQNGNGAVTQSELEQYIESLN
ncbi:MAG: hypothetical protein HKP58_20385 [Desulfatitalea sp.]|nr:hypothetical protein [Desulfatitalea sp.]NNK02777.1 hypothetical protein [Desulfatitalea sp.]